MDGLMAALREAAEGHPDVSDENEQMRLVFAVWAEKFEVALTDVERSELLSEWPAAHRKASPVQSTGPATVANTGASDTLPKTQRIAVLALCALSLLAAVLFNVSISPPALKHPGLIVWPILLAALPCFVAILYASSLGGGRRTGTALGLLSAAILVGTVTYPAQALQDQLRATATSELASVRQAERSWHAEHGAYTVEVKQLETLRTRAALRLSRHSRVRLSLVRGRPTATLALNYPNSWTMTVKNVRVG